MFVTILFVILLIPYTLIAIGTGYTFRRTYNNSATIYSVGTASIFFGAWIGATLAFLIARYLIRNKVKLFS